MTNKEIVKEYINNHLEGYSQDTVVLKGQAWRGTRDITCQEFLETAMQHPISSQEFRDITGRHRDSILTNFKRNGVALLPEGRRKGSLYKPEILGALGLAECSGCKARGALGILFSKNKSRPNGWEHYCKECRLSRSKNYTYKYKTQTPDWLEPHELFEIDEIYKNRPEGHHVDHIVPVAKGGLHVPWNLQYLPASENISKSDKVDWTDSNIQRILEINKERQFRYDNN